MALDVVLTDFKSTSSLDKLIYEVAVEDVQTVLRYVAATEILAQKNDFNNPPTSLLVDNRGNKDIDTAEKRVQAFFATVDDIRVAVYEAWNQIQALTRVATGRAAASYELWFKEQPIGHTPAGVELYIDRFNPATDYFRIVGPVLVYGRKIYWNPTGKPRPVKRVAFRYAGVSIKLVRIRGIMNQVEQSLRRKYRNIVVTEDWVVTAALPKDGRTPGVWIGFKRKGTLLTSGGISG